VTLLSRMQEELHLFELLGGPAASCSVPVSLWLEGPFDAGAAGRSLEAVAARHDSLRIVLDGARHEPALLPRLRIDVPTLAAAGRAGALASARAFAAAGFPAGGPLVRAAAWRVDERHHLLSVVLHHLTCDGPSVPILLDELAECYAADVEGRPPALEPDPPSFLAAVAAERAREASGEVAAGAARLARRLRGVPDVLDLGPDRAAPERRTFACGTVDVALGPTLTARILDVARAERCTVASVLMAAYGLLLAERTGRESLAVSVPVANRTTPEELRTVGPLVNAVPTPLHPGRSRTFPDLLRETRDALFFSSDHGHVPFQEVVRAMRPARARGRQPLCQVEFAHTSLPAELRAFGPLRAELVAFAGQPARYDLSLDTWWQGPRLHAAFVHALDLLSGDHVETLARRYERILHDTLELVTEDQSRPNGASPR
jgi:hypothetical protein